jgi:hypothetical protein
MQINAFVTDIGHQEGRTGEGRLPVRTAVVTIFCAFVAELGTYRSSATGVFSPLK